MSEWTADDLHTIIEADDLKISPFREDGATPGTPTWIWCVEVDGSLYVRAYNGSQSRWFASAIKQKAGQIVAAGKTRNVRFEKVVGLVNDAIDDAYRKKYSTSRYLKPMLGAGPRCATVRVLPCESPILQKCFRQISLSKAARRFGRLQE